MSEDKEPQIPYAIGQASNGKNWFLIIVGAGVAAALIIGVISYFK